MAREQHYEADRQEASRALADARGYNTDVDLDGTYAEQIYKRLERASRIMRPWSTDGTSSQRNKAIEYLNEITSILSHKIGPASRREFPEQKKPRASGPRTAAAIFVTSTKAIKIPAGELEAKMRSLGFEVSGYNNNPRHRAELQGAPKFSGILGPMYGGEETPLRYETTKAYRELSLG